MSLQKKVLLRDGATAYIRSNGYACGDRQLGDLASDGEGPDFRIINGRACYTEAAIDEWLEKAAKPSRAKKRATEQPAA